MSRLATALYGFPPGTIVTKAMMADRKACLEADPLYSTEALRQPRSVYDYPTTDRWTQMIQHLTKETKQ